MPAGGMASFWRATAFSRGASSNPRSRQNAKPTALWPWLSTYWRWISMSVQWRSTPSIMEATSEEEHRSEEHTSELQSLMRISYAGFCLKKQHGHKGKEANVLVTVLSREAEFREEHVEDSH